MSNLPIRGHARQRELLTVLAHVFRAREDGILLADLEIRFGETAVLDASRGFVGAPDQRARPCAAADAAPAIHRRRAVPVDALVGMQLLGTREITVPAGNAQAPVGFTVRRPE